jgi:hypothetical protein
MYCEYIVYNVSTLWITRYLKYPGCWTWTHKNYLGNTRTWRDPVYYIAVYYTLTRVSLLFFLFYSLLNFTCFLWRSYDNFKMCPTPSSCLGHFSVHADETFFFILLIILSIWLYCHCTAQIVWIIESQPDLLLSLSFSIHAIFVIDI